MQKKDANNDYLRSYARYFSLTFQMIALVLLGGFGGKALDGWLQMQRPVCTVILIVFATFLSLYLLFKTIQTK